MTQVLTRETIKARPVGWSLERYAVWPLAGITLLALGLRAWGLNFGLPSLYHPDEPLHVQIAQHIIKTGDLNPHFFDYPSLFFYILALVYVPYYLVGKLLGIFNNPADMPYPTVYGLGVGTTNVPSTFLVERWVVVLSGVATVVLVYFVARVLFDRRGTAIGLIAAFVTAVSPANVANSRFITPNMMLTCFGVLALLGAALVLKRGGTRDYVLAAVGAGLTASIKYNGALVVVTLAVAHFLRAGVWKGLRDWRIYMTPLIAIGLFFLTTPFALLDSTKFLADLRHDAEHYATAHFGMEGDAFVWYVQYLWTVEGLVLVPALLEIGRGLISRYRPTLMLSIFPAIYFIFISTFVVRNDRTVMPILPFEALLGASFLVHCFDLSPPERFARALRASVVGAAIAVLAVSLAYPLFQTVDRTQQAQSGVASRNAARDWINANLPPGSTLAVEAYGPVVDDKRFKVDWIELLTTHDAAWYASHHFDYLVFSGGIFNRFYRDPGLYAPNIQQYDTLFHSLTPLRTFPDPFYEIRIYKVPR